MTDSGPVPPLLTRLREEWAEALAGRAELAGALSLWTLVLDGWARWSGPDPAPLAWDVAACAERWERGVPLLAEAGPPAVPREALEELIGPVMECLATSATERAEGLARLASAWDRGEVDPWALLPGDKAHAAVTERLGLESHLAAFLALGGLRPALQAYFARTRTLPEGAWDRGGCPWCGAPPGYGDIVEDGRRRLSCHFCGGAWIAARLRCPFCGTWESGDLVRLVAEGALEGYFVEACRACHGYLKGVDRRQRWNAVSPVVEDWASPHLDLYARRQGYWRPTPSLAQLLPAEEPA